MNADEAALVQKCLKGDKRAFEELVIRYQAAVYNLCYRLLTDRQEVMDVAQETFIKAYCSLPTFRGGSFSSWLFRIANNLCIDHLRRRRFAPVPAEETVVEQHRGYADCMASVRRRDQALDQRLWLDAALSHVPVKYRQVMVLHYFEGLTCEEIAEILKRSVNTVKTRLRRARQRLRMELSERNGHEMQASG